MTVSANARGFTVFETPIGPCGVAWNARGIMGLQLPETTAERTRVRIRRRWSDVTESTIASA